MKGKRFFTGLRMTEEQRSMLSRIQKDAKMSKTDALLRGLELLDEYYSLGLDRSPLSHELKRVEEEAVHHIEALRRIRRREETLKGVIREIHDIDGVVDGYGGNPKALIQILLDVQKKFGWISKLAVMWISERLEVSLSSIYRIATFYKVFSLTPGGRHRVRVCLGTACHVRGGQRIMERAERVLGVGDGEVTPDGKFGLERVNCLGCCALGPIMVVDDDYHGNLKPAEVEKILSKYG